MTEPSLFRRLFASIFLMLVVLFAVGGWLVLNSTGRQINDDYDSQLMADSHTVWTLVHEDLEEGDDLKDFRLDFAAPELSVDDRDILTRYGRWRGIRLWKEDKLAAQSENLEVLTAIKSKTGFSQQKIGQDIWRIYTVYVPDHKITVEVWENLDNRHRLVMSIARGLIEPGLLILPVLALLLGLSIRHAMRRLLGLAKQVKNRRPDDLQPIEMTYLPREIAPLTRAINRLLERVQHSIERERQFMDNVAHELKTPLSVLRLQGELIAKAPTESLRQECIDDLIQGIDRATHLFDQLLMFSRLSQQSLENSCFQAVPLVQDVIAQRAHLALAKKIEIGLEAENHTIQLWGNPELVQIMLGALLDNALKYTPTGGAVMVVISGHRVRIIDNGPGIADHDCQRVFDRFVRGKNTGIEGSGLGLAIVHEICAKQHIGITLAKPETGSGLVVILDFPDHPDCH